jgi:hypothetical protein
MKLNNKTINSSWHTNSVGLIKRAYGQYALYLYPEITVASSTLALSTVAPMIPKISTGTVAFSSIASISTMATSSAATIHILSSTVAPIQILPSSVVPTITEASTSTVALISTVTSTKNEALSNVAPTNILILSTVSLVSTVASLSSETPHNYTSNTEWPLALKYNIDLVNIELVL